MLKIVVSGLTFVGLFAALLGTSAKPAAALPVMQPQTSQAVNYWYHHHWYRNHPYRWHRWHHPYWHHRNGLTIHL